MEIALHHQIAHFRFAESAVIVVAVRKNLEYPSAVSGGSHMTFAQCHGVEQRGPSLGIESPKLPLNLAGFRRESVQKPGAIAELNEKELVARDSRPKQES